MTVENISWSISTKECRRPRRGLNPRPPGLQPDGASNWATEAGWSDPGSAGQGLIFNPGSAEPGYTLPLQTMKNQILQKPTDLDLYCFSSSMWIRINNLDQVTWLAEKLEVGVAS